LVKKKRPFHGTEVQRNRQEQYFEEKMKHFMEVSINELIADKKHFADNKSNTIKNKKYT
jgi:hypothetical protein